MSNKIKKIYHAAIYVRLSKEDGDFPALRKQRATAFQTRKILSVIS